MANTKIAERWYMTGSEADGAMIVSGVDVIARWPAHIADSGAQCDRARLMAQAPALLDALEEIRQHAAPLMQAKDPLGFDIDRIARNAIKEATS